jgi:NAD(P)-dependent dehydrogenase (short-subunit alcohol dehydrogenase family)
MKQVVVNYASSSGAAEEVASQIKSLGGDAIVVGADLSKAADIDRFVQGSQIIPCVLKRSSDCMAV